MPKHAKIPLTAIKALTLRDGRMTTHRRVKAVPQLQCTGGLCAYAPDTVQCTNTGDDGAGGVQWRCEADLPQGIKFGDLDVVCEGWGKAGDSNVLAGSCSLEFNLVQSNAHASSFRSGSSGGSGIGGWLFSLLFLGMLGWILYRMASPLLRGRSLGGGRGGGPGGGGGGGGGGPGSWWPGGGSGPSPGGGWGAPPPYTKTTEPGGNSGPGFWTGVAAGAAGSALWGAATRRRELEPQVQQPLFRRAQAAQPVQRVVDNTPRWDDEPGPSRRATGYGGSRTR